MAGPPPGVVDQRVVRHAEEPAPELAFRPVVGLDLAEQLDEDVLDDVIGIGLVQALLAQEGEQHGPVNGVELAPPFGILLANADDDRNSRVRV